jgi:hypothetical protein
VGLVSVLAYLFAGTFKKIEDPKDEVLKAEDWAFLNKPNVKIGVIERLCWGILVKNLSLAWTMRRGPNYYH